MSSWDQPLTLWEKAQESWNKLVVFAALLSTSVTALFRGANGAKTYKLHVLNSLVRTICTTHTPRYLQLTPPSTDEAYRQFMARRGLQPDTVLLNHGAKGHWIGNKDAKKVLIYYHGGGFFLNAYPQHYNLIGHTLDRLSESGHDLAVFFLSYTLTPHAVYPTQLRQAVEALRYILTETGRSPANVFLGGDSAGGNLSLAVLLHLTHPHPDIAPLEISQPLAGVFGHAPWVKYSTDGASFRENRYKDIICPPIVDPWSQAYLAGKNGEGDPWSEPAKAPVEWWEGSKTENVLIVVGRDEALFSAVGEFVEKFKKAVPNTVYVIGQGETHVAAVYAVDAVGIDTQQSRAIIEWLGARL
ncbi:putative 6-hexanolactone hydrolase [Aspergillus ibericus CBS 121593]|uniref:Alpha/beta hydrolase fold protein n=1 Tax=Aspergillus ibericus CBS 121593 TaxID=1448316 RepID=A0A395GUF3_9EURO|nr:alpha/beta hydrolase fold protein [Aspergillus ibericus CBS 121593]RAK98598.1 alpha/beta hydrolase fold protein [Aspergillus ibericus CBS 121593]